MDRCVYERTKVAPTLLTYTVSAVWHGFYPGYYFTFIFFGLETEAARKVCVASPGQLDLLGS